MRFVIVVNVSRMIWRKPSIPVAQRSVYPAFNTRLLSCVRLTWSKL